MCLKGSWLNALSKTDLKSQSRSTYLVPRLHRLLVIAESTDALLGNLFELEDLGAKDVIFRAGGSLGGGAAKLRRLPQRCFPPPSAIQSALGILPSQLGRNVL